MTPDKSSLFNKIPTFLAENKNKLPTFLVDNKISPKILLMPLEKCAFYRDLDPDYKIIPGSG